MLVLVPTLLLTSGCQGALSTVDPAGPAAREIALLWWILLGGAAVIFLLVMALLAAAIWRRGRGQASEKVWFWGLGLAFPFAVLSALTVYGLVLGERLLPRDAPDRVTVSAEARQWAWRFGYDDAPGVVTEDILHIPAGRPVDVQITSIDVVHSFWVPRLAGKLDALPGRVNVLRLQADTPGDYAGTSAEFSGLGYSDHNFTLRAHDADGWAAFLAGDAP